jgi:hypothetical protein
MVRRLAIILLAALSGFLLTGGSALASPEKATAAVEANDATPSHKTAIYLYFEQHDDGSVTPASYPTGCGLTVLISRWGNWIDNDTYTGCNFAVASIQHNLKIQRSRWYGWETLRDVTFTPGFNTTSKFDFLNYDCTSTGIHDFRVIGSGQVIPYGGSVATAAAYDQLDEQNCG